MSHANNLAQRMNKVIDWLIGWLIDWVIDWVIDWNVCHKELILNKAKMLLKILKCHLAFPSRKYEKP